MKVIHTMTPGLAMKQILKQAVVAGGLLLFAGEGSGLLNGAPNGGGLAFREIDQQTGGFCTN